MKDTTTKQREIVRKALFNAGVDSSILTQTVDTIYSVTTTPAPVQIDPIEVADLLIQKIQNDAGNADCMEILYADKLRYDHTRQMWLAWDGQRWEVDQDKEAERLARETAKARYSAAAKMPTNTADEQTAKKRFSSFAVTSESARQTKLTLESANALKHFATKIGQYDRDPFLANAGSVTLELKTCTARENRQGDYITKQLGAEYDADANCPRWNRFLGEVFNNDTELIAYVQRAVGYSLTGDTREQKFFLCHGKGANGKSIFLGTLSKLMGEYGGNTPFETFDAETSEARQDLAKLLGTRLVSVIETNEDRRLDEARIKSITGSDIITARELYAKSFDYRPEFKLWIAMNHKPIIRGADFAIWRRIALIPFTQSFKGREDKRLEATLDAELPGILNWALEGLKEWHANELGTCAAIERATEEYKQESDLIGQWLNECAVIGPRCETESGALYQSYGAWCGVGGHRAENRTAWGRRMSERDGIRKSDKQSGKFFYLGVGLVVQ